MALTLTQTKDLLNSVIKKNDRRAIDGPALNTVLNAIIDASHNELTPSTPPSGVTGNIQFKGADAGFASNTLLTWNDSNQYLGVGTASPSARVHVKSKGNLSSDKAVLVQDASGNEIMTITGDKLVNVNSKLSVGGELGVNFLVEINGTALGSRGLYAVSSGLVAIRGYDNSNVGVFGQTDYGAALYGQATNVTSGYGLVTIGKIGLQSLPTSASGITNDVYVYDDGTRKYICIN